MCLDPRPERLVRTTRPSRRLATHPATFSAPALAHALSASIPTPVVRASALRALETLAGDDELVARGWVVLSRGN
jgi:hypothetical protein